MYIFFAFSYYFYIFLLIIVLSPAKNIVKIYKVRQLVIPFNPYTKQVVVIFIIIFSLPVLVLISVISETI